MLYENAGPSTALDVAEEEQPDNNECKIPLIVFSTSTQEEDAPTKTTDDECDEDCESFNSADLMTFAWQIARGMVGTKFILYQRTNLSIRIHPWSYMSVWSNCNFKPCIMNN